MPFELDIAKFFELVEKMPPPAITCLSVLLVGFALKRTEWFPNRSIPLVLTVVVGPIVLILSRYGLSRYVVEGMVYGGVVWLFHAQIWKRFFGDKKTGFDSNPNLFQKSDEDADNSK